MSEEERRELIARQRNALYGEGSYVDENGITRPGAPNGRGPSPLAFHNEAAAAAAKDGTAATPAAGQAQDENRSNNASSPASSAAPFQSFEKVQQQSNRTSNSASPGGSPPRAGAPAQGGVAPIGTRPAAGQAANPALKRSTTPGLPSPLGYGYNGAGAQADGDKAPAKGDRSVSASSNPSQGESPNVGSLGGWGAKSGVWGKSNLGVQASVWG
jgi:hypothetical protein